MIKRICLKNGLNLKVIKYKIIFITYYYIMADIEYSLDDLKDFMSMGNKWAEQMYKEKKEYLDGLNKSKKEDNITKTNIDLSKIPKDILINAHNQLMNKGVPENMRYYTTNMSKATKDKVLEHIKKQKYSMKEFENIARELHNSKKDENKKGLLIRKQTAKEIEEMNKPKLNIDAFIKDKQKEIDEGLNKRKSKPTHKLVIL